MPIYIAYLQDNENSPEYTRKVNAPTVDIARRALESEGYIVNSIVLEEDVPTSEQDSLISREALSYDFLHFFAKCLSILPAAWFVWVFLNFMYTLARSGSRIGSRRLWDIDWIPVQYQYSSNFHQFVNAWLDLVACFMILVSCIAIASVIKIKLQRLTEK
ncbi:hypothetical protein KS4_08060 [Poriferisphaera corsica]|uniref:Uncharacterized protein n=1 Tax=Poriferisphaera corsica TaxID=2528020 RepID=A0A517YRC7_9BACT|nr:hypothetical protein [Poriferisphaera corsica]QDU32772.1 hypothetical protein KS4_08060 [Poriferisphaera corsica]